MLSISLPAEVDRSYLFQLYRNLHFKNLIIFIFKVSLIPFFDEIYSLLYILCVILKITNDKIKLDEYQFHDGRSCFIYQSLETY